MRHHALRQKSAFSAAPSIPPSVRHEPPLHPKLIQQSQTIIRSEPRPIQTHLTQRNLSTGLNQHNSNKHYAPSEFSHKTHKRVLFQNSTVEEFKPHFDSSQFLNRPSESVVRIVDAPRIDRIRSNITAADKVTAFDRQDNDNRYFRGEVVEQQVIQHSPTYDYNMQQQEQLFNANGWPVDQGQQEAFYQQQPNMPASFMPGQGNGWEEVGGPPEPPQVPPGMMGLFGNMIASGANQQVMDPFGGAQMGNFPPQMPFGGMMNSVNLMAQMNPMQMSAQDFMPPPVLGQDPSIPPFDQNFGGVRMGFPQQPVPNHMMESQKSLHENLNFSQASSQLNNNFFNAFQSQPLMNQGPPQFFQQGIPPPPPQAVPPSMMQLSDAMAGLFQPPPHQGMDVSQTRPMETPMQNMAQSMGQMAQSMGQMIQQGHAQLSFQPSYHGSPPELITCVICKETYDVNNTRQHVQRHKNLRVAPKNERLQAALGATTARPTALIPKHPIIRPIVEPEECVLAPQGNTYVIQRIHRLQGQPVTLIDDYPQRVSYDPSANRMSSTMQPGIQAPIQRSSYNPFENPYQPQGFQVIQQEQFQSTPYMMTSQTRKSNMGSQMRPQSDLSDFSYNYLGDQLPPPPQTGVIASQKMRVPRQVLAAWHG